VSGLSVTERCKSILLIVSLAVLVWASRLFHEGVDFPNEGVEALWLIYLRPTAIAILGLAVAAMFIRFRRICSPREFWVWSFVAAAFFCIPYIPDMHASFVKAGEKNAFLLSAGFYALGILTYGLVRGLSCVLAERFVFARVHFSAFKTVALYLLMLSSEFLFFHTWHPITYFPALPLPLPSAQFHSDSGQDVVRYVLFETQVDARMREQISNGNSLALAILGNRLAEEFTVQRGRSKFTDSIVLILPETFVSLEAATDVYPLMQPLLDSIFKQSNVSSVAWVQGAFLQNNNVVLGTEVTREKFLSGDSAERYPPLTVLRRKREQMPMFEAPSKGVSYSEILNDGHVKEESVPTGQRTLAEFVATHQILICYESLFPVNWIFNKPTLVLTNHHLFNEFHLMNWVYVGFLRQLSFLFRSPTKVVSNYNPSGVLNRSQTVGDTAARTVEGFAVVRLR
jgi:hypothetical protein